MTIEREKSFHNFIFVRRITTLQCTVQPLDGHQAQQGQTAQYRAVTSGESSTSGPLGTHPRDCAGAACA